VSNIPLGGRGPCAGTPNKAASLRTVKEQVLTFARILVSAASRGRLTALSTTSRHPMNTTANMGSARKRAAHAHRLCRTLLNVGEANKHIPEDGALADDVDLDAIRRLVSTLVRSEP
jgi:hypothetical protein